MKALVSSLLILSSVSAFADCSMYLVKEGVTEKQSKILNDSLINKGYNIVEAETDADYFLKIESSPRDKHKSKWFVFGQLFANQKTQFYSAGDYGLTLPLHMVTFTISNFIPTKGAVAMSNFAYKLPDCSAVKASAETEDR
jgi:hypothetical protein